MFTQKTAESFLFFYISLIEFCSNDIGIANELSSCQTTNPGWDVSINSWLLCHRQLRQHSKRNTQNTNRTTNGFCYNSPVMNSTPNLQEWWRECSTDSQEGHRWCFYCICSHLRFSARRSRSAAVVNVVHFTWHAAGCVVYAAPLWWLLTQTGIC